MEGGSMGDFAWPGIVSCLALLVYYFTLLKSGMARGRFNVPAPSHEGPEEYLRHVRAHQNTLEHLVLFLPGIWLFAFAVSPLWAAGIGLLWPVGRLWYALGYYRSAEGRTRGLLVSMPPIYIFVVGSLVGFVYRLI
jgi:glutathione S-transferase